MEGVVLVEMSSGALHYTKSFSDAFDVRHPKTERLNLGALIFALQNFAGSSIRATENNDGPDATKGPQPTGSAEIVMFATPIENMVLAATPSNQLLVVLFTTPDFAVDVAKWVVGRVAFNYENGDNAEMQVMTALNQVSRRFRHAFTQAVDEAVKRELIRLSESILIPREGQNDTDVEKFGDGELFLFFYYSPRLGNSRSDCDSDDDDETGRKPASPGDRGEECRKAVRPVNPTLSKITRSSTRNISVIRNMMASTRAIVSAPIKRGGNKKKKSKKKTRWRSRNAVMDHSEPHEFQRVVEIHTRERKASLMEPHRTGEAFGIADVLLPFLELSGLSLLSSDFATTSKPYRPRSQKLDQLVWKNVPGASSADGKQQAGTDMIAWRSGPCCIFYPITAICVNPENNPRVRLAVTAVFDALEPLLKAKAKKLV